MMTLKHLFSYQKNLLIAIIAALLLLSSTPSRAAFSIITKEERSSEKTIQKKPGLIKNQTEKAIPNNEEDKKSNEKEDQGVYGILAFVFGLIGIFPAAIVLGIIGSERNRKHQGLAIAGLILGLIPLLYILIVLGVFIAVI